MAKKKTPRAVKSVLTPEEAGAYIAGAGKVLEQPITETLETNFMPYAMSVIVSRAIPEIDGFKPSHRKLLYTMYTMGLLKGPRIKSANIAGQTMQLNPHGDAAIYDTMVRLSRGYEALLHPYVDSKGNFGKAYSRDMQCAASRYTEAKLESFAAELFRDIDKDTVDFVDNYDATKKEPTLFPVCFPTVLLNANTGIAVGMASSICPFNLREICETTIAFIHDENCNISDTLTAPDFPGGGSLVYDREELEKIYKTGRGGFKVRANYTYDKSQNCIDIKEIPPTTTCEAIIEKIIDLSKAKKITEITDVRDETGINGLKITIDLKRGVDPDKLMQKLYKMTTLQDTFSCNFNILIAGSPKVMGIAEILSEWLAFRTECIRRRVYFDLTKAKERLHLLKGLEKILLDIDKAIRIVRETEEEDEVVPNLMIGFSIDKIQAEYVAEIKLRHLNREYILKRTEDIRSLEEQITEHESILSSKSKVKKIIINELNEIAKKHGQDRKTQLVFPSDEPEIEVKAEIPSYPVTYFFTKEGYFKKITPLSLRMGGEHKLKDGDMLTQSIEADNTSHLLFFSNASQVYKSRGSDFDDTKASVLGDYVASKLEFDKEESAVYMAVTDDYSGYMIFVFENGKVAKVDMKAYETKTNRKKLIGAYSDKSPLVAALYIKEDAEILVSASNGRRLLVSTAAIAAKSTKNTQGVNVMSLKKGYRVISCETYTEGMLSVPHRYRTRSLPAAGKLPAAEEAGEQLSF
ncbi:MAG: DNA topoisomerase (ATP-hydrolyzing) subunit A [Acutalibacteraceae bacterium]|nr:DNA topoisomerase (ATP-hydrolyzing) subunit A [Acutalibacteraceae bacterium]